MLHPQMFNYSCLRSSIQESKLFEYIPKLLEVIVTSADEAREAQAGGADRLELSRALETGGLTPDLGTVREVLGAVSIPVRVILRENSGLSTRGHAETSRLQEFASRVAALPIDGIVVGFASGDQLDLETTEAVLSSAENCRATLHRAFDEARDPFEAIRLLKQLPQIDRILTSGGGGGWQTRQARLFQWERAAHPEIQILLAIGLDRDAWHAVGHLDFLQEVHAGRAARVGEQYSGAISRAKITALKVRLL